MAPVVPPQVYMRIVASAIFFYDFLVTVPSEVRMYRRQRGLLDVTHACMLYIATRYLGLFTVISGMAVYFGNLTRSQCTRVFPLVGAMRAILSTATSLVLLWRTWAIWGRSRNIIILMSVALIPTTVFSYGFLFTQQPFWSAGTCTGYTEHPQYVLGSKWSFALFNMLYDFLACVVSSYKLVRHIREGKSMSRIPSILLSDGIGYFVIVTVAHAINLISLLTQPPERETLFTLFTAALTSILSQRIILALAERVTILPSSSHSNRRRGVEDVERGTRMRPTAIAIGVHTETVRAGGLDDDGSVFDAVDKPDGTRTSAEVARASRVALPAKGR